MPLIFSECLIERDFVPVEQVLAALMEQLRSIPSTAEAIYELNLIAPLDFIKILSHQQIHAADFRGSAAALGLWSDSIAKELDTYLQKMRRPIGEILVKNGHLTIEKLTSCLDSYIESYQSLVVAPNQGQASASTAQGCEPLSESPPAPVPANVPAQIFDSLLVGEYIDCYHGTINPTLKKVLLQLAATEYARELSLPHLRTATAEFVAMRAAANFLGAKRCENICNSLIKAMDALIKNPASINPIQITKLVKNAIEIFDGIAHHLSDFQSEDGLDQDLHLQGLLDTHTQTLSSILSQSKERTA